MSIKHRENLTMLADFLLKDAPYSICPIEQRVIIKLCEELIEEAEANNFEVTPPRMFILPNDMLAVFLIYFTNCQHAKRDGLPIVPKMTLEHFEYTRSSINSSDGSFSTHGETMESIYKRIAKGELEKAGASYRRLIADVTESAEVKKEAETHSKFNSTIAKKPRKKPFQDLITTIVQQNPNIDVRKLEQALKKLPTITFNDDDLIFNKKNYPITGLKDRLSRAKKK